LSSRTQEKPHRRRSHRQNRRPGIDIPEYETVEEIEDAFDEDPDDEFMMEEEED